LKTLTQTVQQLRDFLLRVKLRMRTQTAMIIQCGHQPGALRPALAVVFKAWSIHDIGHPERIGRVALPSFGWSADFVDKRPQTMTVQSLFMQKAVYRRTTAAASARLDNSLASQTLQYRRHRQPWPDLA